MFTRSLFWWIFLPFAAIALLALVLTAWLVLSQVERFATEQHLASLQVQAAQLMTWAQEEAVRAETQVGPVACPTESTYRITLLDSRGAALCDTGDRALPGHSLAHLPQVREAVLGISSEQIRQGRTDMAPVAYVVRPVRMDESVVAVIHVSAPVTAIQSELTGLRRTVFWGVLALLLALLVLSLVVTRRICTALRWVRNAAQDQTAGPPPAALTAGWPVELRELVASVIEMTRQLRGQLSNALTLRNEQKAVLTSVQEAVLAVDPHARVLNLNRAAGELFNVPVNAARKRALIEVVRNPDLRDFVSRVTHNRRDLEQEIELHQPQLRVLNARGTQLHDAEGRRIGALVVLNDITQLRRMELMRREFVDNVSHELKTPITVIRGYVETLLDGALAEPEHAERFLKILQRQAQRLEKIVENLLALSRMEQGGTGASRHLQPLWPILRAALESCRVDAEAQGVPLQLAPSSIPQPTPVAEASLAAQEIPVAEPSATEEVAGPMARVNAPMLESALVNLIANGIRYSPPGQPVVVDLAEGIAEVVIEVADKGPGISPQHLPRLFERFYRVDPGRDRDTGGSGLGLSIVKHIAQMHGGYVDVESRLGQGSRFFLHLPRPPEADWQGNP